MSRRRQTRQRPRPQVRWRAVFGSPLLVAVWLLAGIAALVADRAVRAVGDGNRLQREIDAELAVLVAETAAFAAAGAGAPPGDGQARQVAGVPCTVAADADQLQIRAAVRGRPLGFTCRLVAGHAAPAFGAPFSVCGDDAADPDGLPVPRHLPASEMPVLLPGEFGDVTACGAIARDDSIALLRLPAGTDASDWVLGGAGTSATLQVPASGVVEVPGNLWIDGVQRPLQLRLERDALLLVRGCLFVGRSIDVVGPGRLYVLVDDGGDGGGFADLDGNHRWSDGDRHLGADHRTGPIEGRGNAWFGLPGQDDHRRSLAIGIVVRGGAHLAAGITTVHGPLVLRHPLLRTATRSGMVVTGNLLPDRAREVVPGFAVTGPRRPGRLTALPGDGQTLYPPASPR